MPAQRSDTKETELTLAAVRFLAVGFVMVMATRVTGLVDVSRGKKLIDDFRVVVVGCWRRLRMCASRYSFISRTVGAIALMSSSFTIVVASTVCWLNRTSAQARIGAGPGPAPRELRDHGNRQRVCQRVHQIEPAGTVHGVEQRDGDLRDSRCQRGHHSRSEHLADQSPHLAVARWIDGHDAALVEQVEVRLRRNE